MKTLVAALAALTVMAVAGPAPARVVTITYTGTLTGGFDETGLSGENPLDLSGVAFKAVYSFDFDTPWAITFEDHYYRAIEDQEWSSLGPVEVTIGNYTWHIDGQPNGGSAYYKRNGAGTNDPQSDVDEIYAAVYGQVGDYAAYSRSWIATFDPDFVTTRGLFRPLTYTTADGGNHFFQIQKPGGGAKVLAYGTGALTVAIASIPEPTTWGVMIVGLGFVGATLRRRRAFGITA